MWLWCFIYVDLEQLSFIEIARKNSHNICWTILTESLTEHVHPANKCGAGCIALGVINSSMNVSQTTFGKVFQDSGYIVSGYSCYLAEGINTEELFVDEKPVYWQTSSLLELKVQQQLVFQSNRLDSRK